MSTINNSKQQYLNLWYFILALLLIAGLLASCESLTGSKDDSDPDPDPDTNAARINSFSASDDLVPSGETVTLSWEVSGDAPVTLTLEPGGTDVSGQTETTVTPTETTTYRLIAENESGSDEAELTIDVIADGETAMEVTITGLPAGMDANIAVTDHESFMNWVTANEALTMLAPGTYTVAAAGVRVSGTTYLPNQDIQSVTVSDGQYVNLQVQYSEASGGIFATSPDVEACSEGTLTNQTRERGRMSLNFIRALVGLPAVDYDAGSDAMVQLASLMFAANSAISHDPPTNWHCYTQEGAEGAMLSNIGITAQNSDIGAVPEDFVVLWADDEGVPSLGHRRWLIDPFLPDIAVGLVEGTPKTGQFSHAAGAALRVVPNQDADISGLALPFVAYPRGEFPTVLFTNDWYLSFSVLADPNARSGNHTQVDYSSATVSVEDENGNALTVSNVASDHVTSGLPNQLKWKVNGLNDNQQYTVTISGVMVNGTAENYSYNVHLK